jgi:hypothetical protein
MAGTELTFYYYCPFWLTFADRRSHYSGRRGLPLVGFTTISIAGRTFCSGPKTVGALYRPHSYHSELPI